MFRLLLPILSSVRSALVAKKYDKEGVYVKHYIPALGNMPAKYVYEPWLAPLDVQQKAGCVVGVDYPAPVVDHAVASKACVDKIATAYAAHKANTATGKSAKPTRNLVVSAVYIFFIVARLHFL